MRRSDMDARLGGLYDQVPQPDCKGLCAASCNSPLGMNPRERQRIREHGYKIPPLEEAVERVAAGEDYRCPALSADDRCQVYETLGRPMICRLYGAVESMPCVFGCLPPTGLLPDRDGYRLLQESLDVGNPAADTAGAVAAIDKNLADPQTASTVRMYVKHHRPGQRKRRSSS